MTNRPRVTKRELIEETAILLGTSKRKVSLIVEAFLAGVAYRIVDGGQVHLPGLGTFSLTVREHETPRIVKLARGKNGQLGTTTIEYTRWCEVSFKKDQRMREMIWQKLGKAGIIIDGGTHDGQVQRRRKRGSGEAREEGRGRLPEVRRGAPKARKRAAVSRSRK